MVISFMLHWTDDTIHDAYLEAITTSLSRIRGKSGSGTSPCCFLTCFMCQMPNVQIEFVELVNEKSQSD